MIIRIFKVRVKEGTEDEWKAKVREFSIPWLKEQAGLVSYHPGQPLPDAANEFSMISIWQDMSALRQAVGEDYTKVVLLEDEELLMIDAEVDHYESFD